jgi:hypothetical protein
MQALRLLSVDGLDARIAYYRNATIRTGQFVAQGVLAFVARASHVINLPRIAILLLGWVRRVCASSDAVAFRSHG